VLLCLLACGCSSAPQIETVTIDETPEASASATGEASARESPEASTAPSMPPSLDAGVHVSDLDASHCGCVQQFSNIVLDCFGQPSGCFESVDPCTYSASWMPCGSFLEIDITGASVPITCPMCPAGKSCVKGSAYQNQCE